MDNVRVRDLKMIRNTGGGSDDYGAVGFGVEAAGIEIRRSSCVNCRAPSSDFGHDGGFVEVWNYADNLYVHDNVATNTQGFLEVGGQAGDGSARAMRVTGNTLKEVHGGLFIHTSGQFGIPTSDLTFSGNRITNRQGGSNPVFGGDLSPLDGPQQRGHRQPADGFRGAPQPRRQHLLHQQPRLLRRRERHREAAERRALTRPVRRSAPARPHPSGGTRSSAEAGRPCHPTSVASTRPRLPTPDPLYSPASVFSTSRHCPAWGRPTR